MKDAIDEIDFLAFTIAFAPPERVIQAVHSQLSRWWKEGLEDLTHVESPMPLHSPKEHNPRSKRVALFELNSSPPAVLIEANLNDGYASLSHMVSKELDRFDFVSIRSRPVGTSEWPIEEFRFLGRGQRDTIRHVWSALDTSGWCFGNEGEVQPFEEPETYGKKAIRDRLTRAQIVRYLGRLGVDLNKVARNENCRLLASLREVRRSNENLR